MEWGKGNEVKYRDTRLLAHYDRIVYPSRPSHQLRVQSEEYDCVPSIDASDHKPVLGVFQVAIPRRILYVPYSDNANKACGVSVFFFRTDDVSSTKPAVRDRSSAAWKLR